MIKKVRLKDFRNFQEIECEFEKGINLIVGENGLGKTNMIEAVFFLSKGRSMRTGESEDLIRRGEERAVIEGWIGDRGKDRNHALVGRGGVKRTIGKGFEAVAFLPDDAQMIRGNPEIRRRSVDEIVRDIKPGYAEVLKEYLRGLRQRNEAIKKVRRGSAKREEIHYWDELVVRRGMEIVEERKAMLLRVEEKLNEIGKIWDVKDIRIKYYTNLETGEKGRERNIEKMTLVEEADIRRGATLIGPHRDEISFRIEGRDLRREGSHGEQKVVSIMWKMAHAGILEEEKGSVVLLLDDPFSELDNKNREALCHAASRWEQVIMTATETVGCLGEAHIIRLVDVVGGLDNGLRIRQPDEAGT